MYLLIPPFITLLVWALVLNPLLRSVDVLSRSENGIGRLSLRGVIGFCRPHTVKGTFLATLSGYTLLSVYYGKHAIHSLLRVLISGVFANVFIVGINQLVDVEIDKTNKKNLPVATGELSWKAGQVISGVSLVVSVGIAFSQSVMWGSVISSMCTIGVLYSVPPFRLKRYAVPAALCIVCARALLATIGGAVTLSEAMGEPLDQFTMFHLKVFTSVLVVFTTVIALMKDVPDIEGDAKEGVQSLSILLGPARVSQICFNLLLVIYVFIIPVTSFGSTLCLFTHTCALLFLLMRWRHKACESAMKEVAMKNYFEVVWPLFYFEFLAYLLPVALEHLGVYPPMKILGLFLGIEASYLWNSGSETVDSDAQLVAAIKKSSGIDILSLFKNFRLKGPFPRAHLDGSEYLNEAAAGMSVALNMHSKLTRLSGPVAANAKKLAILSGDWLLARAVMTLCKTNSQSAIQEMAKSIAIAVQGPEEAITETVTRHAKLAKLSTS